MESLWLSHAKRLQAIAASGLYFTKDPFDRERYLEIEAISKTMMAELGSVPLERIAELVPDSSRGYATPKVDVRAAIIRDNEILLVRERSDGLWTMPGGFADIGLSASKNVEKEVLEEAGLSVQAKHLYCVRHKASDNYPPDVRDFYKLFFFCEPTAEVVPQAGAETSEVGYFSLNMLPPLSTGRVIESDVLMAFDFASNKFSYTRFD